jgi:hypothetical protein
MIPFLGRLLCSLALVSPALGAEIWIVQGDAVGRSSSGGRIAWEAGARLHNLTDAPLTVRLLGGSRGMPTEPRFVDVPAGGSLWSRGLPAPDPAPRCG